MRVEDEGKLLRIYVDERSRCGSKLVYEAVVERCLELGLAGATVLRGIQGYGALHKIHTTHLLRLSADLPVVIEIAESADAIENLLPEIERMIGSGLITVEKVRMIRVTRDEE